VTDGDGDATTIQRDPVTGDPLSITSQDGQVTTLTLDARGYLATVANPNNETFQMDYKSNGLMKSFTRPKALTDPDPNANYTTTVTYDALGLLDRDTGAAGGFLQTVRTEDEDFTTVSATTAEGIICAFPLLNENNFFRPGTDCTGVRWVCRRSGRNPPAVR
jgi:YD repeat-containing protein